jgi:hypothetical protein
MVVELEVIDDCLYVGCCIIITFVVVVRPGQFLRHSNLGSAMENTDEGPSIPPSPDDVIEKLRELVSVNYLNHDTAAMHIRATALVARLKSLNRAANTATRARKLATAEARQEMDQTNLGLQNLLYEKRHLEREIEKCRQFA